MRQSVALLVTVSTALWLSLPAVGLGEQEFAFISPGSTDYEYRLRFRDANGTVDTLRGTGAVGRPAISPDGSRVAFTLWVGEGDLGWYSIYASDLDGSGLKRLTAPTGGDFDPAWSPDGKEIAFSRDTVGSMDPATCCSIWTMDADGTGESEVPNTTGGINPSWSPNGEALAFETPNGVYTIDKDGTGRDLVGPNGGEPTWAPSGDRVAYVRSTAFNPPTDELVVVDLSDESKEVWYSPSRRIESPQWDGSTITILTFNGYGYADRRNAKVRRVEPDGNVRVLFNEDEEMIFAAMTPTICRGVVGPLQSGQSGLIGTDGPNDCVGDAVVAGDFDDDGFGDLAVGSPGDRGFGAVHVVPGSVTGPILAASVRVDQDTGGVKGKAEFDDRLGAAMAVGDFDGDGYDDLAVGVPGEDVSGEVDAGAVAVWYGSASGLTFSGDQLFTQASAGVPGVPEDGDRFGVSVAAGDFDHDGIDDLAVGAPGEGIDGFAEAGAVLVLYGSGAGLETGGAAWFDSGTSGVPGVVESDDQFGLALAAGAFDGGAGDDLAIGIPGEDESGEPDVGAVVIVPGSPGGPSFSNSYRIAQNVAGFKGKGESNDRYGFALASGDFDGDSRDDLAIGLPGESVAGEKATGEVNVVYGSSAGLSPAGDIRFHQDTAGVKGLAEADDRFGHDLAVGDIDADGFADLVVGVPGEDVAGLVNTGGLAVLYGSDSGIVFTGDQRFGQGTPGVPGGDEADDLFGKAVAIGDIDGDGLADLIVGSPGEDFADSANAGAIVGLFGSSSGVVTSGSFRYWQDA